MEISLKPSYPVHSNDGASLVGHRLASGRAAVMEDTVERYDALIRSGARRLTGYQRRLFQAEVVTALCGGNAAKPIPLRLGARDGREGATRAHTASAAWRTSRRGRQRSEQKNPRLAADIRIVEPHTYADPELKSARRNTN